MIKRTDKEIEDQLNEAGPHLHRLRRARADAPWPPRYRSRGVGALRRVPGPGLRTFRVYGGSKHNVTESETPLADYEAHVRASPNLMSALSELRGKVLGCWCVRLGDPDPERPEDERCHGHVLQRLIAEVCDVDAEVRHLLESDEAVQRLVLVTCERCLSAIVCERCGKPVEEPRRCYAHPTCYDCLPPPPPLPLVGADHRIDPAEDDTDGG